MNLQTIDFGIDNTLKSPTGIGSELCQKEVAPLAAKADQDNLFPAQLWKKWVTWACWA